jgi:hypothetical protein
MIEFPLQVMDNFLRQYSVAHAIFLLFVFALLAGLAKKSMKLTGLQLSVFGLIFVLTPLSTHPLFFQFFGLALLVVGPVIFVAAED